MDQNVGKQKKVDPSNDPNIMLIPWPEFGGHEKIDIWTQSNEATVTMCKPLFPISVIVLSPAPMTCPWI